MIAKINLQPGEELPTQRRFKAVRGAGLGIGLLLLIGCSQVAAATLVIDSFQYATPAAAQAAWPALVGAGLAGQPVVPATNHGVAGLLLPCAFTTNTARALWDKTVSLDLSSYTHISFRVNYSFPSGISIAPFFLYFQAGSGGWWRTVVAMPMQTDQWGKILLSLTDFVAEGDCSSGWTNILTIRLSPWQSKPAAAGLYLADLQAEQFVSKNRLLNGGFEYAGTEALPDYWGPGTWGLRQEAWVLDTDAWRARWGVDRTVSHSGAQSLRIQRTNDSTELAAIGNWGRVVAGNVYTLSAWLKSDQASLPVAISLSGNPGVSLGGRTNNVDTAWRRYTLANVTAPASSDSVSCFITPLANGTLWLDDVQWEPGATATTYQPSPFDVTIVTQTVHRVVAAVGDHPVAPGTNTVQVGIDNQRRFLVDGQPFLPITAGWENLPSSNILHHFAAAGFNSVCVYAKNSDTTATLRPVLDNAQTNGLKVILWMDKPVTTTQLQNWVTNLMDHPAVIVWYVYDEPNTLAEWQDATNKYNLAKTLDPSRPALINRLYTFNQLATNWPSDILITDYYPVPSDSLLSVCPIMDTLEGTAAAAGKPAWFWVQTTGNAFFKSREPTGPEQEGLTYLPLIHGARGMLYFINKPYSAEQWNELRQLTREVRLLTPVLCSTNPPPVVSVTPAAIHLVAKTYSNQQYLIAANTLPGPVNATLTVAGTTATRATVLFENRSVNVVGGQIVDAFAGFQRHVYALVPPASIPPKVGLMRGSNGGPALLTLTWPGDCLGWVAQSNLVNLTTTNSWFDLPWWQTVWSATATQLNLTVNPGLTKSFYRLRLP